MKHPGDCCFPGHVAPLREGICHRCITDRLNLTSTGGRHRDDTQLPGEGVRCAESHPPAPTETKPLHAFWLDPATLRHAGGSGRSCERSSVSSGPPRRFPVGAAKRTNTSLLKVLRCAGEEVPTISRGMVRMNLESPPLNSLPLHSSRSSWPVGRIPLARSKPRVRGLRVLIKARP